MVKEHWDAILKVAEAKVENGWQVLPEGRSLTLHAAKDGVGLNVSRVEAVMQEGPLLHARTQRGELFVLAISDVFAAASEGNVSRTKKAGFVS